MLRIKRRKREAVSAVVGVILMVAITVAIVASVYVYVSNRVSSGDIRSEGILHEGNITEKFRTGEDDGYLNYYFVLDDQYDVEVVETVYYSYAIGDYYIEPE